MTDDELIARYIDLDDDFVAPGDVRLKDSAIHVWAIVGQLDANHWDAGRVAHDYDIPVVEVEAAIAYYKRFWIPIDGRIAMNGNWPFPTSRFTPERVMPPHPTG